MSAVTHTPGPWHVGGQNSLIVYASDGWAICNATVFHHKHPDAAQADAHLIAAAPDLLAVVQELEESAGYWSEYDVPLGIVDRIRAAIDKAEGRS